MAVYVSTALEQPRRGEAEHETPERRADVKERNVGDRDQKADQRTEAEPAAEGCRERGLQDPQHRKAGERGDECRRRREQQPGKERREQSESNRQQAKEERSRVVPRPLAAAR